jgi:hypothetical protein
MDMVTHIVYDPSSGEVLHVHVEPAELKSSQDEVIHHAGPVERRKLDVLRMHGAPPSGPFRVEDGEFREVEEGSGAGGGVGVGGFSDVDLERRYEQLS